MNGQALCYSSWLPQLLPAQLVVEITAINHKLLFEITALISPRGRKEKEKGPEGCARSGGRGWDGLPWAWWGKEGS